MEKRLYVWGSGGTGQLGLGTEDDHALPQLWKHAEVSLKLETITSGGCHTAGIDADGRLFLWGSNEKKQLGNTQSEQTQSHVNSPSEPVDCIPGEYITKQVACGWWSTLAVVTRGLDSEDEVFSWGSNAYHQLGRPHNDVAEKVSFLLSLPCRLRVASIACGWKHSLLATAEGNVFSWGTGRHGQLGLGSSVLKAETPKCIEALGDKAITSVFCGWEHSIFHSSDGEVFSCGNNRHGQLGVQTLDSATTENVTARRKQLNALPLCVDDPHDTSLSLRVTQIGCGWHFVLCLTNRGELVSWGKGSHGQLGHGTFENGDKPQQLTFDDPIKQIACGSEHVLIVTTAGDLFSCGWGEHGNLGHGDKTNRASLEKVKFFTSTHQEVLRVAAGGAVSIAVSVDRH